MVRVVEERYVVGPLIPRIRVESLNFGLKAPISEKTQDIRNDQWIVELLSFHVRLSQDRERRTLFGMEEPLHSREGHRLIRGNVARLGIAKRIHHQARCDRARDDPGANEDSRMRIMLAGQQIE